MPQHTIGLLHPGEMGSAVGSAAKGASIRVIWASEDRSAATRERAARSGLEDVVTLDRLVAESDFILSICPPDAAGKVAHAVAARGFAGIYVDANAISPDTSRGIASEMEGAGARFVDGGIIGPPPVKPGTTRLYLSGDGAADIAKLFADTPLEPVAMAATIGAASALKMAYAAWTKGSAALLIAVRALAVAEGVEEDLIEEWRKSIPELPSLSERAVANNARKAWRFVGEMEEIAATLHDAGLPDGFPLASEEVYRMLAGYKDAPAAPSIAEVASVLRNAADPK